MRRFYEPLTENWALKLSALGLAFLLWTVVKPDSSTELADVPVRVVNRDPEWLLVGEPEPSTVTVEFSGPFRELLRLNVEKPAVVIPVDDVTDSTEIHILRNTFVELFAGLSSTRIAQIQPNAVRLTFDRVTTRVIPLAARLTGTPMDGYEVAEPVEIDPPSVRVSGASRRITQIDSIRLPAIDVSMRSRTDTQVVAIDTAGLGGIVSPRQALVIVPIQRVRPDTAPLAPGTQSRSDTTRGGT